MLTDAQLTGLWREIQEIEPIQPATPEQVAAIEADYVPTPRTPEEQARDQQLFEAWWAAVHNEME